MTSRHSASTCVHASSSGDCPVAKKIKTPPLTIATRASGELEVPLEGSQYHHQSSPLASTWATKPG